MLNDTSLIRARIKFDPLAEARANGTKLPVIQIPASFWGNLQPVLQNITPAQNDPLPDADVLIITWTTAEAQALSGVFTSSRDYQLSWNLYGHNAEQFIQKVTPESIVNEDKALSRGAVGYYTIVSFNNKKVILFKSELHPAVDGDALPVVGLIQQIVLETTPGLLITTGTAGASGSYLQAGDAVITSAACFDLMDPLSYNSFPNLKTGVAYQNAVAFSNNYIDKCNSAITGLVLPTLKDIAQQNNYAGFTRNPQIFYNNVPGAIKYGAVSSNGFTMDDISHQMGLQLLGIFNEMNDAFIVYALNNGLAGTVPLWLSIRNMSEPQAPNLDTATKNEWHKMYENYGLYTTYNSAFACWAVICGF